MSFYKSSSPVDMWLDRLGFTRGNPFKTVDADNERESLDALFYPVEILEVIQNAERPILVFAPRGGGKSMLRIYLARHSAPLDFDSDLLSVEFLSFGRLFQIYQKHKAVPVADHVAELLRVGIETFLAYLCGISTLNPLVKEKKQVGTPKAKRLSTGMSTRLHEYIHQFTPSFLTLDHIESIFMLLHGKNSDEVWIEKKAYQERRLGEWIKKTPLADNAAAQLLGELHDTPSPTLYDRSPEEQMARFVEMVKSVGIRQVQYLIDGVDETSETADSPTTQLKILEGLLSSLKVMELEDIRFKFFLPEVVHPLLASQRTIRPDRLLYSAAFSITWEPEALWQLLDYRLAHYSRGSIPSLTQLCDEGFVKNIPFEVWLRQEIIKVAGGSPRQLLLAFQVICEKHTLSSTGPYFVEKDVKTAIPEILERIRLIKHVPQLIIRKKSGQVSLEERDIHLSGKPFAVLLALAQHAEEHRSCTIDDLAALAWPEDALGGVSDTAITRAVSRLRQDIGDTEPFDYIINTSAPERGYRLQNYFLEG